MGRTLLGICAYGGLKFLKLGVEALQKEFGYERNIPQGFDMFVIAAKPGDREMRDWLSKNVGHFISHDRNFGFAAAINDMLDVAFVHGQYDNLIIMGNDVIPMPNSVHALIDCAQRTEYEMCCGSEFDVRFLVNQYPEAREHFEGPNLIVKDSAIEKRIWEIHKDFREGVEPDTRKDIRNFTLFKRSAFEKAGYADVGFYSNGYYEDLDACRRLDKTGVSACGVQGAPFFHFWSRTVHQNENRDHGKLYRQNEHLYREKWGGLWREEKYDLPYHGDAYQLTPEIIIQPELRISSRAQERAIINYWSSL